MAKADNLNELNLPEWEWSKKSFKIKTDIFLMLEEKLSNAQKYYSITSKEETKISSKLRKLKMRPSKFKISYLV